MKIHSSTVYNSYIEDFCFDRCEGAGLTIDTSIWSIETFWNDLISWIATASMKQQSLIRLLMSLCEILTMNRILRTVIQLWEWEWWDEKCVPVCTNVRFGCARFSWFCCIDFSSSDQIDWEHRSILCKTSIKRLAWADHPLDSNSIKWIKSNTERRSILLTFGSDESIRVRRIFRFRCCCWCSSIDESINRHRSFFSLMISIWKIPNTPHWQCTTSDHTDGSLFV